MSRRRCHPHGGSGPGRLRSAGRASGCAVGTSVRKSTQAVLNRPPLSSKHGLRLCLLWVQGATLSHRDVSKDEENCLTERMD